MMKSVNIYADIWICEVFSFQFLIIIVIIIIIIIIIIIKTKRCIYLVFRTLVSVI